MNEERIKKFLKLSNLFAELEDHHLLDIARMGGVSAYRPGDTLIREGQKVSDLMVVFSGTFEVYLESSSERPTPLVLTQVRKGGCFGEYSWIDGAAACASVRCVEEGQLFHLPDLSFERYIKEHHGVGMRVLFQLLASLIERLRLDNRMIDRMTREPGW